MLFLKYYFKSTVNLIIIQNVSNNILMQNLYKLIDAHTFCTNYYIIFNKNIMIFYKFCFCYCSNTLNFDTFDRVLFHALYFLYHHYDQMEVILSVNRIKLKLEYCRCF